MSELSNDLLATASPVSRWTENNYLAFTTVEDNVADSVLARWNIMAAHLPNHPAIVTDQQTLTYQQLDQQAAWIANTLLAANSASELVALLFAHGSNPIVAMLGAVKADFAYVALNTTLPLPQLQAQLLDSMASVIVTDQAHITMAQELAVSGQQVINLDALELIDEIPFPVQEKNREALFAIFYTSGSSGEPKGVMVSQDYILQDARRSAFCYEFNFTDRVALIYEWSYAIGSHLTFSSLLNGSTLYLSEVVQKDKLLLPRWVAEQQITILHLPIPLFRHLGHDGSIAPVAMGNQLEFVVVGGMKLQWRDVARFVERFGCAQAQVEFGYGMTEAGRVAMQWLNPASAHEEGELILAGFSTIANELLIVDEQGEPLPAGGIGEVVVSSHTLALGYWQQPELTALRFHTDKTGQRTFLTGDVGCIQNNGKLEILGRKDEMVKVRGYRIVLSAIEATLLQLDCVEEAAVIAPEEANGERRLIAYLSTPQAQPKHNEIYQQLTNKLANYEIPHHFVFLDTLPKTVSGKIDYQALPEPSPEHSEPDNVYCAPSTLLEQQLVNCWESVLAICPIGIRDDFFEIGGTSLIAVRLFAQIEKITGQNLPISTLFSAPTIEQLVGILQQKDRKTSWNSLVPIQSGGSKPILFLVPPAGCTALIFSHLSNHLGAEQPVYGFDPVGLEDGTSPHKSVEEMATHYIEDMRQIQPTGPYYLGGMCFGAHVTLEMARQLQAQDQAIMSLLVLDASAPYSGPSWTDIKPKNKKALIAHYIHRSVHHYRQRTLLVVLTNFIKSKLKRWWNYLYLRRRHYQFLFDTQRQAQRNYLAASYSGRLSLFQSEEYSQDERRKLRWGELALEGMDYYMIPNTTHRSLYWEEEHIQILAEKIKNHLSLIEADTDKPHHI